MFLLESSANTMRTRRLGLSLPIALIASAALTANAQTDSCGWESYPEGGPGIRSEAQLVYDSARHRVIMWGGYKGEWPNGEWATDLWAWTGAEWVMLDDGIGPNTPDGRQAHRMVYDSWKDQIVLFGGVGDGEYFSETWAWDGGSWLIASEVGPPPRYAHSMAFDSTTGETVMFGGTPDSSTVLSDTWTWKNGLWSQESPDLNPSARAMHAAAYDARGGSVILFGGSFGPPDHGEESRANDTWSWNGANRTWHLLHDGSGTDVPGARNGHALAYDTARGVIVLFGGWNGEGHEYPETWEWSEGDWKQRAAFGPEGREGHGMVYDIAHGVTVLFGGASFTGERYPETWTWSGSIRGDYNGDGVINTLDVLAFLNAWTTGCP